MFCGQSNQAVLKRVLLAYARWNKAVGYCQGFNMLAALILQVVDRCERDAVKVRPSLSLFSQDSSEIDIRLQKPIS